MPSADAAIEDWVGRSQSLTEVIHGVQVRQLAATLNDAGRLARPDAAPLPAGWHWAYFNPLELQSRLGDDGHPQRGDFLPPVACRGACGPAAGCTGPVRLLSARP